jgi:hypothetical protein
MAASKCSRPRHAGENGAWDGLHERFEMKRINRQEAYSFDGARTKACISIAGAFLLRYNAENSWREDNRCVSNGDQSSRVAR